MRKDETATLLALVSSLDRQPVNEGVVEMWWRMLGDYSFEECEAAIIPAYKEMTGNFISAKDVWSQVRRSRSQPVPRQWVKDLHDMGEHFECREDECARWKAVAG
jgi:hypothetical protein